MVVGGPCNAGIDFFYNLLRIYLGCCLEGDTHSQLPLLSFHFNGSYEGYSPA